MPKRYLGNIITDTPTEPTGDAASGVWSIADVETFKGALAWPTLPDAPTIGTATDAGTGSSVNVAFTAPELYGGTVSQYTATSSPSSITGTGSSSPITVTGLTAGTAYTFTVAVATGAGTSPSSSSSNSVTPAIPNRGLFAGGSSSNVIDYNNFNSSTFSDFGDLSAAGNGPRSGCGSETRILFATVGTASRPSAIEYVTPTSTGNSSNFGSLYASITQTGCSNSTRGIFAGGVNFGDPIDYIRYVTIASTGSASTFGSLSVGRSSPASTASTTRAVFAGGQSTGGIGNVIDYVTIASTGNATDFGDLTVARRDHAGGASSTRGVFGGGNNSSFAKVNTIDYITIGSTGNATDFGDLTVTVEGVAGCSNTTYALWGGGYGGPSNNTLATTNIRTIASTGNASGWGNLTVARTELAAASNCHGGI